jgi:hypothetical protein
MFNVSKLISIKKSIVFSWLLYYALILMIPVFISVFTYIKTAEVVENEINTSNMLFLKRVQQQMDLLLSDTERLSLEISLNTSVNNLLNLREMSAKKISPYEIYKVVKDLSTYKTPNSSIDGFYLYFKSLDLIVTPDSGNDSKSFFEIYFGGRELSYQNWMKTLSDNYKGDFIILDKAYSRDGKGKAVIYAKTIPFLDEGNASANIIMTLDASKFIEDAQDIETLNKGTLLILNKENETVISSKPEVEYSEVKYGDQSLDKGMFHGKLNNSNMVISYITSQVTSWRYLNIMPESVFWQKYQYIRNLTFSGLVICIVIGSLITWLSLKKNYNPINNIINLLEKRNGVRFERKNNEFLFINEAIDRVYREKENVDNILAQQNRVLRSNMITRLLKGRTSGKVPVEDLLSMYDIHFESKYFAVLVFYIEDFKLKTSVTDMGNEELDILENFRMVQSIITDVVEAISSKKSIGYMVEIDEMMACLVNFKIQDLDTMKKELMQVAFEVQEYLKENRGINIKVSASNIHETLTGIPEAYDEALESMEYKKLLEIEEIINFEDIKEYQKGSYYYYPLEVEQKLINSIKVGDFEKSGAILNDICKSNFEKPVLSMKISKCLMFDLVFTMIKIVNELRMDADDRFLDEFNPIDRLQCCESINEMKNEMTVVLSTFCNHIKEKNKKRSKSKIKEVEYRLKEKVISYVLENYKDFNLGITTIASEFDIHPINLSKVFLEQSNFL